MINMTHWHSFGGLVSYIPPLRPSHPNGKKLSLNRFHANLMNASPTWCPCHRPMWLAGGMEMPDGFGRIRWSSQHILGMSSGQIIATSHDLTANGGLVREIPLFQENQGWWTIVISPKLWGCLLLLPLLVAVAVYAFFFLGVLGGWDWLQVIETPH